MSPYVPANHSTTSLTLISKRGRAGRTGEETGEETGEVRSIVTIAFFLFLEDLGRLAVAGLRTEEWGGRLTLALVFATKGVIMEGVDTGESSTN